MKIYVASKYEERTQVRKLMDVLEAAGHTITYDWTSNEEDSASQAWHDAMGVITAEAFVFLAEKDLPYCGALVEMGIALGKGIPVYVVGHALDQRCIFLKLQEVHQGIDSLL